MPCDQVITSHLDLANVDRTLLGDALVALGYTVDLENGRLTARANGDVVTLGAGSSRLEMQSARGNRLDEGVIKQAYSRATVQSTAKKMGWTLQEIMAKNGSQAAVTYQVRKRY